LAVNSKVIVCSAFITPEIEEEFKGMGISVLKKPFKLDELNRAPQNCFKKMSGE
jgi:hypothetical protein